MVGYQALVDLIIDHEQPENLRTFLDIYQPYSSYKSHQNSGLRDNRIMFLDASVILPCLKCEAGKHDPVVASGRSRANSDVVASRRVASLINFLSCEFFKTHVNDVPVISFPEACLHFLGMVTTTSSRELQSNRILYLMTHSRCEEIISSTKK